MLRSGRFLDRLNHTGETPSLGPPELTLHRQKHKNNKSNNKVLIPRQISKFLNQVRSFIIILGPKSAFGSISHTCQPWVQAPNLGIADGAAHGKAKGEPPSPRGRSWAVQQKFGPHVKGQHIASKQE